MRDARDKGTQSTRFPTSDLGRTAAALTCWLTAVASSSFMLTPWTHSRVPVTRSYVSELEAIGQPHSALFRLSDVVSGAGLIIVAILTVRVFARRRHHLTGCAMLAIAGVASLCDAANPMSCLPSISVVCRSEQDTTSGLILQIVEPHTTSSLVGFIATAGAVLLLGIAATPLDAGFARLSIALAVVTGLLGIGDVVLILTHSLVGLTERARILVFALWLVALGVHCLRLPTSTTATDLPADS